MDQDLGLGHQRFSGGSDKEDSLDHHHHDHHHDHQHHVEDGQHLSVGQSVHLNMSEAHMPSGPEPSQLFVEGSFMKLLAQSPDGTLMCCANDSQLKFVDSRFLKLYETNTPGPIFAACFHPQKYELFLKVDNRTLVFDLATKEYRVPDDNDAPIPQEPWSPPIPPPSTAFQHNSTNLGMGMTMAGDKRRSGSGRPKGSKDKSQRKARSAAAQEFEKDVVNLLTTVCGEDVHKWNAKKQAIDAVKASSLWDTWSKAGLNEQQLVQFVHRLKSKRMCGGKETGGNKLLEQMGQSMAQQGYPLSAMNAYMHSTRL